MEFPTANNLLIFFTCPSGKEPIGHIQCRAVIVMRSSVTLNLAKPVDCRLKHLKHHIVRLT